MAETVSAKVYKVLKKAVKDDIENYSVVNTGTNEKGAGFLGQMCYVTMTNKNSGKALYLIVKQAFGDDKTRSLAHSRMVFKNEITFYDRIWPAFRKFQENASISQPFDKIAKCLASSLEEYAEQIVLENLTQLNFRTIKKSTAFDREHLEFVFQEYGKFHAVSLAYKDRNPEDFEQLVDGLQDLFGTFFNSDTKKYYLDMMVVFLDYLSTEQDAAVRNRFENFIKTGADLDRVFDKNFYKGNNLVLCHGDCWSNNMMFKYGESGKLDDLRLIDFQGVNVKSPVFDLSYAFYAGASKDQLDNLEYFLQIYHASLTKNFSDFGCDANKIFSFEELKEEWKLYSKYGFILSFSLWKIKLTEQKNTIDLTDVVGDESEEFAQSFKNVKYDEAAYRDIVRSLIVHMFEKEFL